jgi:hypothetical protein
MVWHFLIIPIMFSEDRFPFSYYSFEATAKLSQITLAYPRTFFQNLLNIVRKVISMPELSGRKVKYDQKSSPAHFSDDSKWPFRNPYGLTPGGRATPARDGRYFISSPASKAGQSSRALHSDGQSRATFPPTILCPSERRQQREGEKRWFGNKVFGSRWRHTGSLGVAKPQCSAIEWGGAVCKIAAERHCESMGVGKFQMVSGHHYGPGRSTLAPIRGWELNDSKGYVKNNLAHSETFSEILEGLEFESPFKKPQVVEDFWSQFTLSFKSERPLTIHPLVLPTGFSPSNLRSKRTRTMSVRPSRSTNIVFVFVQVWIEHSMPILPSAIQPGAEAMFPRK